MARKKASYPRQKRSLRQKTKRRIIPMTDRVRRLIEYHFAENNNIGMSKRTIAPEVKKSKQYMRLIDRMAIL